MSYLSFYIDSSRLIEGQELGRGGFGRVLSGRYVSSTGEEHEV